MSRLITSEYQMGQPINYRDGKLIPFSQSIQINFPGVVGGFQWNRPISILAIDPSGSEQVIPVADITRSAIWSMVLASVGAGVIFWLVSIIKRFRNRSTIHE